MRVAVIGRTEILYSTALMLKQEGYEISCIVTAKEAPEYTRTAKDFQDLAVVWGVPFVHGPKIIEHYEFLKRSHSEIAVSINYTGIISSEVISLFPLGVLNAHGGDLPRYRGNACQAWAILNGEDRIGLCIHKMIGGELDSGDILARDYLKIDHTTKVTRIWQWMKDRTPELMLEAVNSLGKDADYVLERQSQNPRDSLRCYPRRPEDGRIDWAKSAIDVLRLINASNKPYDGAFCEFKREKLIIWDAEMVNDGEIYCAVPGQITKVGDSFVEVACGSGKLRVLKVECRAEIKIPSSFIRSIRERLI